MEEGSLGLLESGGRGGCFYQYHALSGTVVLVSNLSHCSGFHIGLLDSSIQSSSFLSHSHTSLFPLADYYTMFSTRQEDFDNIEIPAKVESTKA